MILLELMQRNGGARWNRIVATAVIGGLLGAIIVTVANLALAGERTGGSLLLGLAFLLALGVMFACNRWSARNIVEVFEGVQVDVRLELAERLRRAPLRTIEGLGDARGQAIADLTFVSSTITHLVTVIQSGAFVACMTLVIGAISFKALVIWLVTCAAIAWWLIPGLRRIGALQAAQSQRGGVLHGAIEALVEGFDQLKLDGAASDAVAGEIHAASGTLFGGQVSVAHASDRMFLTSNVLFFAIGFGVSVFAPAGSIGLGPALGYEMSVLLALAIGPLFGLLTGLPNVTKAEASLAAIRDVLDRLTGSPDDPAGVDGGAFEALTFEKLRFSYGDDDAGFTVGPIDLRVGRGELVFVTGGNGSGKTTLMKMMLGLYPTRGRIRWDGVPVHGKMQGRYRGLFTAIFGGQFLFERLYGLDVSPDRVEALLHRFGIADVVGWDGRRFGHLQLSSGQRMRLAMVVALLEDRPICLFDEWTANQDPETTWMYYDTLLPELVAAGRTVIAVSHDDRFFDRADHLIELNQGRVLVDRRRPDAPPEGDGPPAT